MYTKQEIIKETLDHPIIFAKPLGFNKLTSLHDRWMHDMVAGNGDMTTLGHRGSYKTTTLSVAIALLIILDPTHNIIFLRKTDSDVVEIIEQVKRILRHDAMQALCKALYGVQLVLQKANATEIVTNLSVGASGAVQLLGIGTGGSVTGKHAHYVFTDDIVNAKDRASRAERERIKLLYQELQNIRNRGGRIINTGTPWHKEDAISIMPNVRKYDWRTTGLIDADTIAELRSSMSPSLFAANYDLVHIAAENALFSVSPTFTADAEKLRNGIAHVDASYGGEDGTAFTVAARVGDTIYAYGKLWSGHVDLRIKQIMEDCARFKCSPVYCEDNGDKGYLGRDIRAHGASCKTYHEGLNKYVKISSYLRKWWSKIVWLEGTDPEYINQIMDYTEDAAHDDAPDSASCICRILDKPKRAGLL